MATDTEPRALLSQKQYAIARDIDPGLLSRWKARGRLVMVGRMVDVAATDERLKATADPRRAVVVRSNSRRNGNGAEDLDEIRRQRARRERWLADEAERRALLGAGAYVERAGVERSIADGGAVILQRLEGFTAQAGTALAAEFGLQARAVITGIESHVKRLQTEIAGELARLAERYRTKFAEGGQ